jgi:ubiquitin-like-conjugating enzyme ATG10
MGIGQEALKLSSPKGSSCTVEYDIVLSPSYCVPAVYFIIRDDDGSLITDIDLMYKLVVPRVYRDHLRDVGVMGGISMINHPIFDLPSFFIHPCQTPEALENAAEERPVLIQDYLQLWLGIIGNSVGLQAPIPAATSCNESAERVKSPLP